MSRPSQTRSRADKPARGAATAPTPAATHDIVTGKYNEHDWTVMLDHDDGDEGTGDLVQDIVNSALDIIYANYIEKQLLPYTITQAKDAILQIVEWQFLSRDEGETEAHTQEGWQSDEEPIPAVTDCWAQGSVPCQVHTPRSPVCIQEEDEEPSPPDDVVAEQQPEETVASEETDQVPESCTNEEETSKADEESYPSEVAEEVEKKDMTHTPQKPKTKKKFRPYGGPLRSAKVSKMTDSLDDMERDLTQALTETPPPVPIDPSMLHIPSSLHSMLKLQSGRPPGGKEVMFDEYGNIIGVMKIDPNKLPSHTTRVRYQIVDPSVEAAQSRLEAMRTGRYTRNTSKATKQAKTVSNPSPIISPTNVSIPASAASRPGVTPLPPPLIDAMEVSPGVVVREGDRSKRGPKQHQKRADILSPNTQESLRQVTSKPKLPHVTVAEILQRQTPYIKPMRDVAPIPPIMPHPPQVSSR